MKNKTRKTSSTSTWLHPVVVVLLSLAVVAPSLLVPQEASAESHAQRYAKQERANKKQAKASRSASGASKKTSKKKGEQARKKQATRKKVVRKKRVRRTRTTTTTRRSTVRRGRTYYYTSGPAPPPRTTYVREEPQPRTTVARKSRNDGPYMGLGFGAVAVNPASDQAGAGLGFALGMRSDNLSLELGLLGATQPVERSTGNGAITQEMSLGGFSGDLKVFLPIGGGQIEPYFQGGLGYYSVGLNGVENYAPAFNLGGGLDFRVSRGFALGGRYLYHAYLEEVQTEVGPTDDAWSLMGTATIYF